MKLSEYVINELAQLFKDQFRGKELVNLFDKQGLNDLYDGYGLPDIGKRNGMRPSKTEYIINRMRKLNDSEIIGRVIEDIVSLRPFLLQSTQDLLKRDQLSVEIIEGKAIVGGNGADPHAPIIRNEARFRDIQNRILAVLEKAEVSIWVVMAWFTNNELFNMLLKKQAEGINVRLVVYEDYINEKHGVDISKIHEVHRVKKGDHRSGGIMHNKFCIIDSAVVITGSYNWSDAAEYKNDENIEISTDYTLAKQYSKEFNELTKGKIDIPQIPIAEANDVGRA